jgi:hypothetical protein
MNILRVSTTKNGLECIAELYRQSDICTGNLAKFIYMACSNVRPTYVLPNGRSLVTMPCASLGNDAYQPMSTLPLSIILLLLAGSIVTFFLERSRPDLVRRVGALFLVLIIGIWFLAGRSLPITSDLASTPALGQMSLLFLTVDNLAWNLSLYLLLLVLVLLLAADVRRDDKMLGAKVTPYILAATVAALLALWAGSLAALVSSWTLLAIIWSTMLWVAGNGRENSSELIRRLGGLLLAVLLLWLAQAVGGGVRSGPLNPGAWSTQTHMMALAAIVVQLGIFPLHWWRPIRWRLPPAEAALIHLLPALAAGSLLARITIQTVLEPGVSAILIGLGFLSLFYGVHRAWQQVGEIRRVVPYLVLAQAGVLIVTAQAGTEAVVAEIRVLVLACGGLFLALGWPRLRSDLALVGPLLMVTAIASLPLTAGFVGLAAIYDTWLSSSGGFLLVAVMTLLLIPLVTIMIKVVLRHESNEYRPVLTVFGTLQFSLSLLLLGLGLLTLPNYPLSEVNMLSWLAILCISAGAFFLSRKSEPILEAQQKLQETINIGRFASRFRASVASLSAVARSSLTAIREASSILEGEGGMLWLLLFIVILVLAGRR